MSLRIPRPRTLPAHHFLLTTPTLRLRSNPHRLEARVGVVAPGLEPAADLPLVVDMHAVVGGLQARGDAEAAGEFARFVGPQHQRSGDLERLAEGVVDQVEILLLARAVLGSALDAHFFGPLQIDEHALTLDLATRGSAGDADL